jgi:hypothetical protein
MTDLNISVLLGKTLTAAENKGDQIVFRAEDGEYCLYHSQDCCESVVVESVVGDLADLVGSPLLQAEEVSSEGEPPPKKDYVDSYTWTFYKLATIKGGVTIRFLGESNGYYSESVAFAKVA